MELKEVPFDEYEREATSLGLVMPIEQTEVWATYQATVPGRTPWGCFELVEGDDVRAIVSLIDYETHGYHYLRAEHGPVWVEGPDEAAERAGIEAIVAHVRKASPRPVFLRLAVLHELDVTRPVLSIVPYDRTVIIDVTGGDDQILARMKPRGRRDVRKALREAPVTCADETERAIESFEEYYAVMVETGARDGFKPAPMSDYQDMIRILGADHCRVFAGRDEEGVVVTWSICTVSGSRATRYYAASLNKTMRAHVTDKLVYFECCELGRLGCTDYDLMAIGSDFSPTLLGLNEFKTKFCKEVAEVAPDRDVPVRKGFYGALCKLRSLRESWRHRGEKSEEERERDERKASRARHESSPQEDPKK